MSANGIQMADNLVELKPPTLEKEFEFAPQQKPGVPEGRSRFNRQLPEIVATEVKGFSLSTLKQSVAALLEASSQGGALAEWNREDPAFAAERQRALERDAYDAAADRWKKESEALAKRGVVNVGGDLNAYMWEWQTTLVGEIKKELRKCQAAEREALTAEDRERVQYGPFLALLPPEKMATITLMEVMKLQKNMGITDGLRSTAAIMNVGTAIMEEYQSNVLMDLNQGEQNQYQRAQRKKLLEEAFRNTRDFQREVRKLRDRHGASTVTSGNLQAWPQYYRAKVGGCLLHLMVENAMIPVSTQDPTTGEKITTNQPAFHYTNTYVRGKRQGIIRLHPELLEKLGTGEIKAGIVNPKLLPMVAKPLPWEDVNKGGYYFSTNRIMRIKQSDEQKNYLRAAADRGDLDGIYEGLNVLGETGWRVNPGVFDVLVQVWNEGNALAEIPPAKLDISVPPAPPKSAEPIVKAKWIQAFKDSLIKKANAHSTRCDINLKLEIARAVSIDRSPFDVLVH
jgi:DNA-directed RNA polymerase, mitochondrial